MIHRDVRDEVIQHVAGLDCLQNPRRVRGPETGEDVVLDGEIEIDGRMVTLRLTLDASFPLTLPRFYLRPWDALGVLPHVMVNSGWVCIADPEGLLLDRRRPEMIVQEALERVYSTLSDGVTGRNHNDFADEFEVYWAQISGGIGMSSMLTPGDDARWVIIATTSGEQELVRCVASTEADITSFYNQRVVDNSVTVQRALYVPLEPGTVIIPPRPDGPFWTAEDARRELLTGLSPANQSLLRKLVKRRPRQREYVIVRLPRPSGGSTLFGVRYDEVVGQHPLRHNGTAKRLIPIQLRRLDHSYLVQRGGGHASLATKRVLVVGCGAVGAPLAFELARAGVLDLTLLDRERLTEENIFRHPLGRRNWYASKTDALKEEIEAQLPYVHITSIPKSIEAALADGSVDLRQYDLVVLALGNPTIELALNDLLHAMVPGLPAIFTWLEPLGIGGHALLTGNASGGGCFECLYTVTNDGDETLANRAAFAEHGQSFGRALSGCGSLHTPYGSIDAVQTANLAARLAVRALAGDESGNPLLSWKGDAQAFLEAGHRLSRRHALTTEELWRLRYDYRNNRCQVCQACA